MSRTSYNGIIIDEAHRDAIKEKIKKCDENCRSRTLLSTKDSGYSAVMTCVSALTKHFENGSESALEGCVFFYDKFHQDFPDNYTYDAYSTQLKITYTGKKWRLLDVVRRKTLPEKYAFRIEYMSREMVKDILEKNRYF